MNGWCLLVVDDSDDHRFITVTELRRLRLPKNARIDEAATGDDALAHIDVETRNGERVVVLSDYRMPHLSGIELLKQIRSRYHAERVRVIIYSSTDQGVAAESLQAGADHFLVKPMDLTQFRADLRHLVERFVLEPGARRRPGASS